MNKFILLAMVVLLSSCSYEDRSVEREVDAVYWHEGQRYTAKIENAGMIVDYRIPPWHNPRLGSIKLYTDVNANEKSWYKCDYSWRGMDGVDDDANCEIHIHNLDELGTADWNHGKFGTGSTTRID